LFLGNHEAFFVDSFDDGGVDCGEKVDNIFSFINLAVASLINFLLIYDLVDFYSSGNFCGYARGEILFLSALQIFLDGLMNFFATILF
jgi:hypothetical protein